MSPTQQEIQEWKAQYGAIFAARAGKTEYIFRSLSVGEFSRLEELIDDSIAASEDEIVKLAVLYPKDIDFERKSAGVISSLAAAIFDNAGFADVKLLREKLEEARQASEKPLMMMKAFILSTMPAYTEEDIDKFTLTELAQKTALAESIIRVNQSAYNMQINDTRVELIDLEEEKARQQHEFQKQVATRKPGQALPTDNTAQRLAQALGG